MIFHARGEWQDPKLPVTGPSINWRTIDTFVIHYTAAVNLPNGDLNEFLYQIPPYLRNIQRDYKQNRGYSIGYNFGVDWLGGVWELRGFEIKCAANANHNEHTVTALMLVDGAEPATYEQVLATRELIAVCEKRASRSLPVTGHGLLRNPTAATSCPGKGLIDQIRAGVFSPPVIPPKPTPPTIEPYDPNSYQEDFTMAPVCVRFQGYKNVFLFAYNRFTHLGIVSATKYLAGKEPEVWDAHPQQLKAALWQSGLTAEDLLPTDDRS